MFCKNLKFYRLKRRITKKQLAEMAGVTPMAITHYENGDRMPDMDMVYKLAECLDVGISDFLSRRNANLSFVHGEFRKGSKLTVSQQEYIKESVEEYFGRFFDILEILGGDILPPHLGISEWAFTLDYETDAEHLREYLSIGKAGPVGNLADLLERRGFLLYFMDMEDSAFYGLNGTVNGRPYIAVNSNMTAERIRTTMIHELAHIAFKWPVSMEVKEEEKAATAIAGAFLITEMDMFREVGLKRKSLSEDLLFVCRKYGIAMSLIAVRARSLGIINDAAYKEFFTRLNRSGAAERETSLIEIDYPVLFKQLVYRAVSEGEISKERGSELLGEMLDEVF